MRMSVKMASFVNKRGNNPLMMFVPPHFLVAGFLTAIFLGNSVALAATWDTDAVSCGVRTNTLASCQITFSELLVIGVLVFISLRIGLARPRETNNHQTAELRRLIQQKDRQLQQISSQVREFEKQLRDILPRFENPNSRLHLDEHGNLREKN
jgi:hypothetical protein